jgi:hypothetical protein
MGTIDGRRLRVALGWNVGRLWMREGATGGACGAARGLNGSWMLGDEMA